MKRAWVSTVVPLSALLAIACDSEGPPPADGGTGGAGGRNTLEGFACGPRNPPIPVGETTCTLIPEGISVWALDGDHRWLLGAFYPSFEIGTEETWYSGGMTRGSSSPLERASLSVDCLQASSDYTPDPCEVELLALERGTVETTGAAGATSEIEVGSRVRLRVMCPDGLYSPSGDDYGARHYDITPSEFVLEAHDCTVED